jgi:hypothetical protein
MSSPRRLSFGEIFDPRAHFESAKENLGSLKPKAPKKTPEELALLRAQSVALSRSENEINERKKRIIRAQTSSRASMLSGNLERILGAGSSGGAGAPRNPGRTGGRRGPGLGGAFGGGGGGAGRRRGGGGFAIP